jgi:hypothetical protein
MADGDTIILGQNNTSTAGTSISRNDPTSQPALEVENQGSGEGLVGRSADYWGVQGYSINHHGVSGVSVNQAGVFGYAPKGYGVMGSSNGTASGVLGNSLNGPGVLGQSSDSFGVQGSSTNSPGVHGYSTNSPGVQGASANRPGVQGSSANRPGVQGQSNNSLGVYGVSGNNDGVRGASTNRNGVSGTCNSSSASGVYGENTSGGYGVAGRTGGGQPAVYGENTSAGPGVLGRVAGGQPAVLGTNDGGGTGVQGLSPDGPGVYGESSEHYGVSGVSANSPAVYGKNTGGESGVVGVAAGPEPAILGTNGSPSIPSTGSGVQGMSVGGFGVFGHSRDSYGVVGSTSGGLAGFFNGGVEVQGTLWKTLGGFRIDHPLDPANLYLNHSFVESSERKNLYDGVAALGEDGSAWVELPEWFEELNRDFRYQLTAIGSPAPELHVAEEISENRFKIAGGEMGGRVSWQVTGVRKDRLAEATPMIVEEQKTEGERGRYLHPELYGEPEERAIHRLQPPAQLPPLPDIDLGRFPRQASQGPQPPDVDFSHLEEEHRLRMEELRRQMEEVQRQMERGE